MLFFYAPFSLKPKRSAVITPFFSHLYNFTPYHPTPPHFTSFLHLIPFQSISSKSNPIPSYSIPFNSIPSHSIPFQPHLIRLHLIQSHSIPSNTIHPNTLDGTHRGSIRVSYGLMGFACMHMNIYYSVC